MTVALYDDVLKVVDSTPRTKDEITGLVFTDCRYQSDRRVLATKVYKALKQLKDEGKIRLEKRIRDGQIVQCYRIEDGRPSKPVMTKMEMVVSAMNPDEWYYTREVVNLIYESDRISYEIYYARVCRYLYLLLDKGLVIKRGSGNKTAGVERVQWKVVS